jgi:hypothetical protein
MSFVGSPTTYKRVPALVTDIHISEVQGGARFPTVRWQTENGRIVEKKLADRLRDGIEVGDEVSVMYPSSSGHPEEDARLVPGDRTPRPWPLTCLLLFVILIFFLMSIHPILSALPWPLSYFLHFVILIFVVLALFPRRTATRTH